jgi:UDP-glucose 4-epimerase
VHLAVPGLGALSPAEDFRVNMLGLINVLEAGRIGGVKRVSVASSGAVYTGVPGPFREDMLLPMIGRSPTESYKKAFEVLAQHYGDRTGMSVVILRITGIYGPLYHSMANLPSRLCHAAVKGAEPNLAARGGVPFEEDAQDLTYAKDCALGVQLVHSNAKQHTVYNIGGGRAVTNGDMMAAARKLAAPGFKGELQPGKGPTWRADPYCDNSRAESEVGYKPQFTIEQAFADYIGWLKTHPE